MKTAKEVLEEFVFGGNPQEQLAVTIVMRAYAKQALQKLEKEAREDGGLVTLAQITLLINELK